MIIFPVSRARCFQHRYKYTHFREKLGHKIIGPANIDGHIVRHVIVVRLGLKQMNNQKLVAKYRSFFTFSISLKISLKISLYRLKKFDFYRVTRNMIDDPVICLHNYGASFLFKYAPNIFRMRVRIPAYPSIESSNATLIPFDECNNYIPPIVRSQWSLRLNLTPLFVYTSP